MWRAVALGPAACLLTALLVPVVRRFAVTRGITDHPKQDRWHRAPTPYLGGVAIVTAAALCLGFAPAWKMRSVVLLLAAMCVGGVGLADDLRPVPPLLRVVVEALAAAVVFFAGARTRLFGGPGDFVVTVGWIVVVTNSFNLLDNVDGALSGVGATIAVALAFAALLNGQVLVGALAAIVAGACLGFLVHNWHPASIFMGDAGSLFLGFLLAAIGLMLRTTVAPGPSILAVLLLVGPALFDTTLVSISRMRARRPLSVGGTDHTSHRLLLFGLSHRSMTLVLIGVSAMSAALGAMLARGVLPALPVAVGVATAAMAALAILLFVPVYDRDGAAAKNVPATSP